MKSLILLAVILAPMGMVPIAQAQSENSTFETRVREIEGLSRAKNLARQAAEAANGGLAKYRAELSMHGDAARSPYKDQGDHWLFTFKGGTPGTPEMTIESEVRVNKADFQTTVVYNGAIRTPQ